MCPVLRESRSVPGLPGVRVPLPVLGGWTEAGGGRDSRHHHRTGTRDTRLSSPPPQMSNKRLDTTGCVWCVGPDRGERSAAAMAWHAVRRLVARPERGLSLTPRPLTGQPLLPTIATIRPCIAYISTVVMWGEPSQSALPGPSSPGGEAGGGAPQSPTGCYVDNQGREEAGSASSNPDHYCY